ncbi:hypothetical protein NM688_g8490 [Phlebia brevispora]|uniref:Uncharacterized protein n=1 Tax=Phlebia brevispora TaxID=194682 RepID=A0ACC1RU12_9APHY|nr:hypothetical protein NM688_g8490 [Phlebia brevispora]
MGYGASTAYQDLVNVEQTFYDSGYQDGFAHGRIHGLIEGRALGREKGFEMWEELGYYEGFALMWKAILANEAKQDERALHNIKHLLDLISQFPRVNPSAAEASDLDIPKLFRQIRSRYKVLCATLGTKPSVRAGGQAPSPERNDDLGGPHSESNPPAGRSSVWRVDNTAQPPRNSALSF